MAPISDAIASMGAQIGMVLDWSTIVWFFLLVSLLALLFLFRDGERNMPAIVTLDANRDAPFRYGVVESIGRRPYMEDRHVVVPNFGGHAKCAAYCVFDGHGGSRAADYCRKHLVNNVRDRLVEPQPVDGRTRFLKPFEALHYGFLDTDLSFTNRAERATVPWTDGTTAIVALILGQTLYVANVGDSRCCMVAKGGMVAELSEDHKPNRPDERQRIESLGGTVQHFGVWRVQGMLAVSRAIGDVLLKRYVRGVPDVLKWEFSDKDRFLVLATDGLWDVMSSKEVGQFIHAMDDHTAAARSLVQEAMHRGSGDNVTVLVVDMRGNERQVPESQVLPGIRQPNAAVASGQAAAEQDDGSGEEAPVEAAGPEEELEPRRSGRAVRVRKVSSAAPTAAEPEDQPAGAQPTGAVASPTRPSGASSRGVGLTGSSSDRSGQQGGELGWVHVSGAEALAGSAASSPKKNE